MLVKPEYLDIEALDGYISSIEGGLRESETMKTTNAKAHKAGARIAGFHGEAGKDSQMESTIHLGEHQVSKLNRLIKAGREDPVDNGWVEVLEPETAFSGVRIGEIIEWECEIYIPEAISLMVNGHELSETVRMVDSLRPTAATMGYDIDGVPDSPVLDAMATFLENVRVSPVVVGELDDTPWQVVGTLSKEWILPGAQLDGPYRIIGKVRKTIGADKWYPLMSLPGMNMVDRQRRRQMERNGPRNEGEKDQFIKGPAVVLDILAIYG